MSPKQKSPELKIASPKEYLAVAVSTCGVGFIPFAPGTFGSLVGVGIFYLLFSAFHSLPQYFQLALIVTCLVVTLGGIWAGNVAEAVFGEKDAQRIVVDEVAGQLISYVLIAPMMTAELSRPFPVMLVGFILFRLFDIFKPYPINKLQDLPAGLGVMFDDVLAGIYAAILLSLLPLIAPQWLY